MLKAATLINIWLIWITTYKKLGVLANYFFKSYKKRIILPILYLFVFAK